VSRQSIFKKPRAWTTIQRRLWTRRCCKWWNEIEAYILTGITNAASEGNNRLIKLEARNAFGFRNRTNQRLRSRCATTRRARRETRPG
jgi:transposase